jgi:endonuclease-3
MAGRSSNASLTAKRAPATGTAAAPASNARATYRKLRAAYPDAHCELDHVDAFQLLVATVLSAQSTDVAVNRVTPDLFRRWPDAKSMSKAALPDVEAAIGTIGMFRQKAKHLVGLSCQLVEHHAGQVPQRLESLVSLPGVGRKTANVVLGVAFGAPAGVVVDTHVQRLSQRLGWTRATEPGPIESDLMQLFPKQDWDMLSHTLIFHGRRCCTARAPACAACPVASDCPSAFQAELVGRKASGRTRERPSTGDAKLPATTPRLTQSSPSATPRRGARVSSATGAPQGARVSSATGALQGARVSSATGAPQGARVSSATSAPQGARATAKRQPPKKSR